MKKIRERRERERERERANRKLILKEKWSKK
jgi:hypothetical protein